jgi:hypothetical protein
MKFSHSLIAFVLALAASPSLAAPTGSDATAKPAGVDASAKPAGGDSSATANAAAKTESATTSAAKSWKSFTDDPVFAGAQATTKKGTDGKEVRAVCQAIEQGVESAFKTAFPNAPETALGECKNLVKAVAAVETSFGTKPPLPKGDDKQMMMNGTMTTKIGTLAEEVGILRMNVDILTRELGYSDFTAMKDCGPAGAKIMAEAFVKGLAKFGFEGLMHFHRGGRTRYSIFKGEKVSTKGLDERVKDITETDALKKSYFEVYKAYATKTKCDNEYFYTEGPSAM